MDEVRGIGAEDTAPGRSVASQWRPAMAVMADSGMPTLAVSSAIWRIRTAAQG